VNALHMGLLLFFGDRQSVVVTRCEQGAADHGGTDRNDCHNQIPLSSDSHAGKGCTHCAEAGANGTHNGENTLFSPTHLNNPRCFSSAWASFTVAYSPDARWRMSSRIITAAFSSLTSSRAFWMSAATGSSVSGSSITPAYNFAVTRKSIHGNFGPGSVLPSFRPFALSSWVAIPFGAMPFCSRKGMRSRGKSNSLLSSATSCAV